MKNCPTCGQEMPEPSKRGRGQPRKFCEKCRPSTKEIEKGQKNSAPIVSSQTEGDVSPTPAPTPSPTEEIVPGIQVWTSADERREAQRSP